MVATVDALALTELADNPASNVTLSNGWESISAAYLLFNNQYSDHGLSYTVYINTKTKEIAIAFGDNINSGIGSISQQYVDGEIDSAVLQLRFSPSTLGLMRDAANLSLSIFAATQPGYSGEPIATVDGVDIGAGYKVFVTGAGRGGAAAEYAMEQIFSEIP